MIKKTMCGRTGKLLLCLRNRSLMLDALIQLSHVYVVVYFGLDSQPEVGLGAVASARPKLRRNSRRKLTRPQEFN